MTAATHRVIDDTATLTEHGYGLTRVNLVEDDTGTSSDTVRVTITRDIDRRKPLAVADVLTPDRHWTTLITDPPERWFAHTGHRPEPDIATVLGPLADRLTDRAARILNPGPLRTQHRHERHDTTADSSTPAVYPIGEGEGTVLIHYSRADVTAQIVDTGTGVELRWTDGINDWDEPYPEVSVAIARLGVLIACAAHQWRAFFAQDAAAFWQAATAFHATALDIATDVVDESAAPGGSR